MSVVSNKREIEEVYLNITEDLDKILLKYGDDVVSDEFLIEIMELIRDILDVNNKNDKSIMVFNEELIYKGELYNTFYNLYKKLNPSVVYSNRFVKKMDILKKNIDPIKKGNRCITCKFPFVYIINTQIYKVCIICRKLEVLRTYYIEHNDKLMEKLYLNLIKEIHIIFQNKKTKKTRDKLLNKLKLIIENLN